jgi:hypothetical protein
MLGQCSLRHRFPVCSSGGNSNRKSSFWRLVGICAAPLVASGALHVPVAAGFLHCQPNVY